MLMLMMMAMTPLGTDGLLARWLANPYTLKMEKSQQRKAMRWFAATY